MSLANPVQLPISIGLAPQQAQGARCVGPIQAIFTTSVAGFVQYLSVSDDLVMENQDGTIDTIQSLYFDASVCWSDAILTMLDTGQTLRIPAKSCGYLPILCSNSLRYNLTLINGSETQLNAPFINLWFFNTPCQPFIWNALSGASTGCSNSSSVAPGNTIVAVNPLAGFAVPANRNLYVSSIAVAGSGATAEGVATVTLTNICPQPLGAVVTLGWGIEVPILGVGSIDFKRTFNPPLRAATNPIAGGKPGFTTQSPILSCSAAGAGNAWMQADINYFVQ